MSNDQDYLAKKEQYLLKSTFVRRKIRSENYLDLLAEVKEAEKNESPNLDWSQRGSWGITEKAWQVAQKSGIDPIRLFCHPGILQAHPRFVLYYRSVSLVSQKGFLAIIKHNPKPFETGQKIPGSLSENEISDITKGLNELFSNTLEQGSIVTIEEITSMYFAQAGMTIDGSWRNQIGEEGQLVIWNLVAQALYDRREIASVCSVDRPTREIPIDDFIAQDAMQDFSGVRKLLLANEYSVSYGSDPDLIVRDPRGATTCAIEVKAGLDPAGALERTGAVLKSFESVLAEYPDARTILVTSCETEESKLRLNESDAVHLTYLTAQLTTNLSLQRKFVTQIRKAANLVSTD